MMTEQGDLEIGVEIDGVTATAFVLRPPTLADTYRAAESVRVPDDVDSNKAAMVAYQMALDDAIVLCQLTYLGALSPVPSPDVLAEVLDPDDMAQLRQAASVLKKKRQLSKPGFPPIVEPNTCSSEPASV